MKRIKTVTTRTVCLFWQAELPTKAVHVIIFEKVNLMETECDQWLPFGHILNAPLVMSPIAQETGIAATPKGITLLFKAGKLCHCTVNTQYWLFCSSPSVALGTTWRTTRPMKAGKWSELTVNTILSFKAFPKTSMLTSNWEMAVARWMNKQIDKLKSSIKSKETTLNLISSPISMKRSCLPSSISYSQAHNCSFSSLTNMVKDFFPFCCAEYCFNSYEHGLVTKTTIKFFKSFYTWWWPCVQSFTGIAQKQWKHFAPQTFSDTD